MTFTGNLKNKGTLEVPASSFTTIIDVGGTLTNKKAVVFDGATQISAANFNNRKARLQPCRWAGSAVSLTGPMSNAGVLSIAAGGSLAISSSYQQGSTAMFEPQLASTSSYGVLNVTDGASLAGTLAASDAAGFTPPSGSTYVVLTSGGLGGTAFEHVTGAVHGAVHHERYGRAADGQLIATGPIRSARSDRRRSEERRSELDAWRSHGQLAASPAVPVP